MREDAYVTWAPFAEERQTRFSRHGAFVLAADIAVPLLFAGVLAVMLGRYRTALAKRAARMGAAALVVGLLGWGATYLCLPKTEVVLARWPRFWTSRQHAVIAQDLAHWWTEHGVLERPAPSAAWVREQLVPGSGLWVEAGSVLTNLVTGEPYREEDPLGITRSVKLRQALTTCGTISRVVKTWCRCSSNPTFDYERTRSLS
jgi:hypothetical protein